MPITREEVVRNLLLREVGVRAILQRVIESYNDCITSIHFDSDPINKQELLKSITPQLKQSCTHFYDHKLRKGIPFTITWDVDNEIPALKVGFKYADESNIEEIKKQAKSVFEK